MELQQWGTGGPPPRRRGPIFSIPAPSVTHTGPIPREVPNPLLPDVDRRAPPMFVYPQSEQISREAPGTSHPSSTKPWASIALCCP